MESVSKGPVANIRDIRYLSGGGGDNMIYHNSSIFINYTQLSITLVV